MAYKKVTGPDFPKWPSIEVDPKRGRARVHGKALDWKGHVAWRKTKGVVGMMIFMPLLFALAVTIIGDKFAEEGIPVVGVIIAAGFVFGLVIEPFIKNCYMKAITVVVDKKHVRAGGKKHPRTHRGMDLAFSFVIQGDAVAEKKARTDGRLNERERFDVANSRNVMLVVQSDFSAHAAGVVVASPGVAHKLANVVEAEQADNLANLCNYAVRYVESLEQGGSQPPGQQFDFD